MLDARKRPSPKLLALGGSLSACARPSAPIEQPEQPELAAAPSVAPVEREQPQSKRAEHAGKPKIVSAQFIAADRVQIHFSEPIVVDQAADPNDFRLSLGYSYAYRSYAYAYYYELGYTYNGNPLSFTRMRANGATLDLYLAPPFDPLYCSMIVEDMAELDSEPGIKAKGGIFLHYAPGEAAVEDRDGNQLAPIAPRWVEHGRRGGEDVNELGLEGAAARRALRDAVPVGCAPVPT